MQATLTDLNTQLEVVNKPIIDQILACRQETGDYMAHYDRTDSVPLERLSADGNNAAQRDVVKLSLAIDQQTVVVRRAVEAVQVAAA
jgi:hypothetical protein